MSKERVLEIFNAALAAVDPGRAMHRAIRLENGAFSAGGSMYRLEALDRVIVVGAGKATAHMAEAIEDVMGPAISAGLIVVKYGHTGKLEIIRQLEAGHPIPDGAGVEGTRRIIDLVRDAGEKTLVLCLLSGGGSALLVSPQPGITLEDKQKTTDLLLKAGASIDEQNAVRKHLSAVKGGRLAQAAYPATIVTLVLSDVIGDRLDVIASGPTVPDSTTFADAARVIGTYGLQSAIPERVAAYIKRGLSGQEPETAKSADPGVLTGRSVIVGGIAQALSAAREKARVLGCGPEVVTETLAGEARVAASLLAQKALQVRNGMKPGERRCLLSGGETTVMVRGRGKGGRNQELALAFAEEIAGTSGITLLSAGTDGTDGPTDAAGAIVNGKTAIKARELGIYPEAYLENNDSYSFFQRLDELSGECHHLKTGPTGTNVMDLQVILVEG